MADSIESIVQQLITKVDESQPVIIGLESQVSQLQSRLVELQRGAEEKDAQLQRGLDEKDAQLQRVVAEKDAQLQRIVAEKDAQMQRIVAEKDAELQRGLDEKDAQLQRVVEEKDAQLQRVIEEKRELLAACDKSAHRLSELSEAFQQPKDALVAQDFEAKTAAKQIELLLEQVQQLQQELEYYFLLNQEKSKILDSSERLNQRIAALAAGSGLLRNLIER